MAVFRETGRAWGRLEGAHVTLWSVHGDGRRVRDGEVVAPDERLSWPLTAGLGVQHFAAMFGATVLVPALTGFPVTTTLLFSGVGTLLFLLLTRNRVPSYLGSSFAFVAPLSAAAEEGMAAQLGAVLAAGAMLVVVGIAVKALGVRLLHSVMPPVVTGGVVVMIGLNLAPHATAQFAHQPFAAAVTLTTIAVCLVCSRGLLARMSILAGVLLGWIAAAVTGGLDQARLDAVAAAPWLGFPELHAPILRTSAVVLVVPVVIVLVAENVAHVKAVAAVTGRDLDGSVGDALIADGLATTLAGFGGGSGTTTYAENIGVMAATKVFSTAAYVIAALSAVVISCCPKFGAAVGTLPDGVLGGAALVLYGLIALLGVRIWQEAGIAFTRPTDLVVVGTAIVAGVGNLTLTVFDLRLEGIAWGSALVVLGHPLMRRLRVASRPRATD